MPTPVDYKKLSKALKEYRGELLKSRCLTLFIELNLLIVGLRKTERILSFFSRNVVSPPPDVELILLDRYTTIFNQVKNYSFLKGRCLSQSLAMRFLLRQKGILSELRIGVNITKRSLDAHAWLEKDGQLLNDHPSVISQYVLLSPEKINSNYTFK